MMFTLQFKPFFTYINILPVLLVLVTAFVTSYHPTSISLFVKSSTTCISISPIISGFQALSNFSIPSLLFKMQMHDFARSNNNNERNPYLKITVNYVFYKLKCVLIGHIVFHVIPTLRNQNLNLIVNCYVRSKLLFTAQYLNVIIAV